MPPDLLPPVLATETLLARRAGCPAWDDPSLTTTAPFGEPLTLGQIAERILTAVERDGEHAVRALSAAAGSPLPDRLEVTRDEVAGAARRCPPATREALALAAERVRAFHAREDLRSWQRTEDGLVLGQRVSPVERAGVYAPGGAAPLASSLLMAAVPARVAGVGEVVACTPPGPGGALHPLLAAAALAARVDRVFLLGGPLAVTAMAVGAGPVPRVDVLCAPGGGATVAALARVAGRVGVISLPGPTETLVIADGSADPELAVADLLAQAEHDPLAWPVLVTTSRPVLEATRAAVATQLPGLARAEVARRSLADRGAAVLVADLDAAAAVANRFAAEHVCLLVADPWALAERVTVAGGLFVGEAACEALGDYVAGPSHIMPTGGSARWSSPVSARAFTRVTAVVGADRPALERLAPAAIALAEAEGLTAHAASLRRRLEDPSGR